MQNSQLSQKPLVAATQLSPPPSNPTEPHVSQTSIISITEQKTFAAKFGGRTIAGLAVESAWKGFTNYVGAAGNLIIEDATMRVITGSASLLSQLGLGEPQIGDEFEGGIYAGLTEVDGKPARLIQLPGLIVDATWDECMAWVKAEGADLPTRAEQRLLYQNLKDQFEPRWHWSSEQHAGGSAYAWYQHFNGGVQDYRHKSSIGHARPVRRLPI